MYRKGVAARKQERERKRKIKELMAAEQEVPPILLVSIPDPEKIWLAEQEEMKLQEQLRQQEEEEEEEEEEERFHLSLTPPAIKVYNRITYHSQESGATRMRAMKMRAMKMRAIKMRATKMILVCQDQRILLYMILIRIILGMGDIENN